MDETYEPSPYEFVADHVEQYESTGGAQGADFHGFPCVVLTTTGRLSGKLRKSPLIRIQDGENYVVVASMGGQPTDPLWFRNLQAEPKVLLQDHDVVHELRARPLDGDERAKYWDMANGVYPEYTEYQTRCERQIPVVLLEPR